jgi:Mycoplasma protein of unknown function, DUF285
MNYMFCAAYRFNQDVSCWDVRNVCSMKSMFRSAVQFNKDLSDWDISEVGIVENMFRRCISYSYSRPLGRLSADFDSQKHVHLSDSGEMDAYNEEMDEREEWESD